MEEFDAIVVGARVAGAATAMLLARQGLRVLVLDRGRYGTDTLSTHALLRGGVHLLSRWGLLDQIVASGTPPVTQTRFHYDKDDVCIDIRPLYAPRRTVLDRVLVDAAVAAGAVVRFGATVTGLLHDRAGAVVGAQGVGFAARASLVVGADGIRSAVARYAGAATRRAGRHASAVAYGYWSGLETYGYEWFYRPGLTAGFIPTNSGETGVFVGCAAPADLRGAYHRMLAAACRRHEDRLERATPPQRLRTWVGRPGFVRQGHGPGWVLVGDAAYFLDPLSAHGITDALRDAQLLSAAVLAQDVDGFTEHRDQLVGSLFETVDEIAGHRWDDDRIRRLLLDLNAALAAELALLTPA